VEVDTKAALSPRERVREESWIMRRVRSQIADLAFFRRLRQRFYKRRYDVYELQEKFMLRKFGKTADLPCGTIPTPETHHWEETLRASTWWEDNQPIWAN